MKTFDKFKQAESDLKKANEENDVLFDDEYAKVETIKLKPKFDAATDNNPIKIKHAQENRSFFPKNQETSSSFVYNKNGQVSKDNPFLFTTRSYAFDQKSTKFNIILLFL